MDEQSNPQIIVSVEVGSELSILADMKQSIAQQFIKKSEASLATILRNFGVPGQVIVEIKTTKSNGIFSVLLNGSFKPYSQELFRNLWECFYHLGSELLPVKYSSTDWLRDYVSRADLSNDTKCQNLIVEFLSTLVSEIIKQEPGQLFESEQAIACLSMAKQSIPEATSEVFKSLKLDQLTYILKSILELGISITDAHLIIQHITEGLALGNLDDDIIEGLIPRLSPAWLEITIHPSYLKQLVNVAKVDEPLSVYASEIDSKIQDMFAMMSDGLFYELGIRVPDIRVVTSENLRENTFAFRINDFVTSPRIGLQPNQLLVNDTSERLELLRVEGLEAVNPANNIECSIIDVKDQQTVEDAGLTTWDPIGYLILAMSRDLRRHAGWLLNIEKVEYELARLHEAFPELIIAVLETLSLEHLTRVLRELLNEEISIRNLRCILERALNYGYVVSDSSKYIIFDDRLTIHERLYSARQHFRSSYDYAQHIREGLKHYISHKYTRGGNTLVVYLLDPEIEERIIDHLAFEKGNEKTSPLTENEIREILNAIHTETDLLPQFVTYPIILTITTIRSCLRKMIANAFPLLAVLSYDELSPDMNIQPIARISLD